MALLIELQLDVLLARDAHGRLAATRDPAARPAPRLFLGRSAEGNVWGVRTDVPPATRDALDRLCSAEPKLTTPGAERSPVCRERVRELLAPVAFEWRGPAYVLPEELPRDDRAREVTAADGAEWLEAFAWLKEGLDAFAPVVIAFEAGQPPAVCHSPRGGTPYAAEAGVETLEPFRGRGLATAAVAAWRRRRWPAGRARSSAAAGSPCTAPRGRTPRRRVSRAGSRRGSTARTGTSPEPARVSPGSASGRCGSARDERAASAEARERGGRPRRSRQRGTGR